MKYRTKIILIVISLSLLINVLTLFFFISNNKHTSIELLHNKIAANNQLLNQVNSGPLYDGDISKLSTNLKSFVADPEIVSISLQEHYGSIELNFDKSGKDGDNIITSNTIITYNDEKVGTVTTLYTTKLIDDHFATSLRFVILTGLFVGLFLSVVLFFVLKKITRPIRELTELSTEIANGNLDKEVTISGKDEIGTLAQSLVTMRNSIRDTIESLEVENQERKHAEQMLQRAKNYIDNIINSMPSLLVGVDHQHKVIQWNKQAESLTGISFEKAVGVTIEELLPQFSQQKTNIDEAINSREVQQQSGLEIVEEGQTRFKNITIFPLVDDSASGAVLQIDDVTEQHEIRRELAHSRKLDAVGQLAGGVAHDFNNMLAGILGAAELLYVQLDDNEKAKNYLNLIIQSGKRAGDLTGKLLTFARKGKVESTPVSVEDALNGAVSILEHSIDKKVAISATSNVENSFVVGDLSQIQNALINLGVNSGLAMPDGGKLTFTIDQIQLDDAYCEASPFDIEPGLYVQVAVHDTGIGIPADNLHYIFEPFFTTRPQGSGSGLGLSAVYGTVQQHSGAITVSSEEGRGTTFHLFLPLAENQCLLENAPKDGVEKSTFKGSGIVLVVEDEAVIRTTAGSILESLGYRVLMAEDGQQGLELFQSEHEFVDLVLMDMIMPKMNGQECFFEMKKIDPDVRVILASGFSRDADLDELKKAGLKGFLKKPYTTSQLSRIIADSL